MTKMRSPTKTELLVMRAHVDSMLDPQDGAGFHVHLIGIRTIVDDCIGNWAIERVEELERELVQKRVEADPEAVALVEAAKQWRETQEEPK